MTDSLYAPVYRDGHQPLVPWLYDALRANYGEVKFANEGEPFHGYSQIDPATGRPTIVTQSSGEYYCVCCPYCREQKYRLWVNHMYGQPGPDGRAMTHLIYCFRNDCLSSYDRRRQFADRVIGLQNRRNQRVVQPPRVVQDVDPTLTLSDPPGPQIYPVASLPVQHKAYQYMVGERRYPVEWLRRYQIGYVQQASRDYPTAYDRIYFPIYMYGQLVGWQCRYIGDLDWKRAQIPKYYSRPHMKRRFMLYNYDQAYNQPFVIVVEGPTSCHPIGAHPMGNPSVATLGKSISPYQFSLLLTTWQDKPIYLMFDPDAREQMRGTLHDMVNQRRAPVVEIVLPGEADPGNYTSTPTVLWDLMRLQASRAGVPFPTGW